MLTPKGHRNTGPIKRLQAGVCHEDDVSVEQRWVEVFADHVRRRFNSRAIVSVRIRDEALRELAYVYAIENGGLVLTLPSGEHHEETPVHHHGLWNGELGTGGAELWISSPEQVVFEVQRAQEGELCTGFGLLGLSRTPHLVIPRGDKAPPPRDHHEHGDF